MIIVWDEPKRLANLDKHGLDFRDFEAGFSFERYLTLPVRPSRTGRVRYQFIGTLYGRRVVAAIVSPLGAEAIALVSLRPASVLERDLYDRS